MPRLISILALLLGTHSVLAQGISGVTRRTPALEKQATARRFFDAAGVATTGQGPASGANAAQAPAAAGATLPAARPRTAVNLPPPRERPFMVRQATTNGTPRIATRPQTVTRHAP